TRGRRPSRLTTDSTSSPKLHSPESSSTLTPRSVSALEISISAHKNGAITASPPSDLPRAVSPESSTSLLLHQITHSEDVEMHLKDKANTADLVCCLQNLQMCFQTEERARKLLLNVSSLLKPGGYFFGITPDSSTIWAKYQKNVEAYHNRSGGMKPNIVPNCIRSENYTITFEVEEEKFPIFGKKYQLKFANDISPESHHLVHFPSFIRLAREAGLEYVEIQNLTEFYDDNRTQFAGMIMNSCSNLVDPRGRLLPRSYDVLGLYTTFIFQKPDPDISPPLMTPELHDVTYIQDESEWQVPVTTIWRDDEKTVPVELPHGLGKISEQKGILGPGPAELRFSEAL
ncbi:mRNA cap guanine-N7 methyltransferase 2-like, partial [Pyrus x bretschneideri]|uniref:mRNA cap guanine-N7 methyltransferase 2-like n=1 Tax=Pyrus x bretschneideri TaxID=225117 RepID=UPI0020303F5A